MNRFSVVVATVRIFLWVVGLFFLVGCQEREAGTAQDVQGEERIVVLGVALAETVFDLGRGGDVVAVDESCTTVQEFSALPRIGYYRNFSVEGVLSLDPSLVLVSSQAGPPAAVEQLQRSGVRVVVVQEGTGIDGVPGKIREVAGVLGGVDDVAEGLVENFLRERGEAAVGVADGVGVLFLMSPPSAANWLAAGRGTVAEQVIEAAGGRNVVVEFEGYKPLSREALATLEPELVILPTLSVERAGGRDRVYDDLGFSADSAVRAAPVWEVDLAEFLSNGPRLGRTIKELREKLEGVRAD